MFLKILFLAVAAYGIVLAYYFSQALKTGVFPRPLLAVHNILFGVLLSVRYAVMLGLPDKMDKAGLNNLFPEELIQFVQEIGLGEANNELLFVLCLAALVFFGATVRCAFGFRLLNIRTVFWISILTYLAYRLHCENLRMYQVLEAFTLVLFLISLAVDQVVKAIRTSACEREIRSRTESIRNRKFGFQESRLVQKLQPIDGTTSIDRKENPSVSRDEGQGSRLEKEDEEKRGFSES